MSTHLSPCMNSWSRNDAGLAAAELALAVEKHVLESGSVDTVGTIGEFFSFDLIIFYSKFEIQLYKTNQTQ